MYGYFFSEYIALSTGLEPATSCLEGKHSIQLSYESALYQKNNDDIYTSSTYGHIFIYVIKRAV